MSSVIYHGTWEQYRAEIDAERAENARRRAAESDPAQQCHHGISLYRTCRACGAECGE